MNKRITIFITMILMISMVVLSSCARMEFTCTENTEKAMTISAKEADKKSFFMTGSLVVEDGEKLIIHSNLDKGTIRLEFLCPEGMDDGENLPDVNVDPTVAAEATGKQTQEYEISPGDYLLNATVVEKATGTIKIEIQPAGTVQ